MFIDTNYNKKIKTLKIHLATPNKKILHPIFEHSNTKISLKLGQIHELNFSIPYYLEDEDGNLIYNEHVETIREKMLIRVILGNTREWFVIDSISEDDDDSEIFNVTAFSLGYELKGKRVHDLKIEGENATGVLTEILSGSSWKIHEIDPLFDTMHRTFESGSDSNILNCVMNWAETFGGLIEWDTIRKRISLRKMEDNGRFRGLTVRHDRLIKSITKSRTTDELVTRLYIEGSEGLTINSVNPTGQRYIEDFSYFMYPFEADGNDNVIQSSYYMSDELCLALIRHERIVESNAPIIRDYLGNIDALIPSYTLEESALNQLLLELDNIQQLLDLALASEDQTLISQRRLERQIKEDEVNAKRAIVNSIKGDLDFYNSQIDRVQGEIANQASFTPELLAELDPYIIESTWKDDRYIDAKELYEDGLKRFVEIREPKIVIDTTIDNLLNILDEQYFWDKLYLGDYIKVKYKQMKIDYMAKIIEMEFDIDNDEVNLVISNKQDLLSDTEKLVQLLYDSKSATSLLQNNKHKWDKVVPISDQISSILRDEWDATKNKIIAGVNNSVEVGKRGIIIKNPDFPNEIVIMQSGVIALSKDEGETWKTAIKPDGIVAERLIGRILIGQELLITNSSGSFTMDENGAVFDVNSFKIMSGGGSSSVNLVDRWQNISTFAESLADDNLITAFEKRNLRDKWDEIHSKYQSNQFLVSQYFPTNPPSYVSDYTNAYNALRIYLFETPQGNYPLLSEFNMESTTRIVSATFKNKFEDYNFALSEFEKHITIHSKNLADTAIDLAREAQENIDEVMNDVVYKIELHSSNGLVFKNGDISTTITARVYRGKDDITSTIPNTGFIWRKFDRNGVEDIQWYNSKIGVGNVIIVSHNDILAKATFRCDIDIEDD